MSTPDREFAEVAREIDHRFERAAELLRGFPQTPGTEIPLGELSLDWRRLTLGGDVLCKIVFVDKDGTKLLPNKVSTIERLSAIPHLATLVQRVWVNYRTALSQAAVLLPACDLALEALERG